MARPIIIDTDPGIDDAIAILLALRCPELDVRGLTAVAGNISVERSFTNAARVLALGGITPGGLPLLAGMRGPLASSTRVADEPIHGGDGLGDAGIPPVDWPIPAQHAVDWMEEQIRREPGEITIVAIGPLTNVAALIQRLPDPALIAEVVIMGGSVPGPGNVTPAAEFNFYADPEAARVVLHSGVKCRMVGLNVTRRALLHLEDADRLEQASSDCQAISRMSRAYIARYEQVHGIAACAMHDPLAVAVTARPELVTWKPFYVDIECHGELTRGMSVADIFGKTGRPANVLVGMDIDGDAFRAFLTERLLGGGSGEPLSGSR